MTFETVSQMYGVSRRDSFTFNLVESGPQVHFSVLKLTTETCSPDLQIVLHRKSLLQISEMRPHLEVILPFFRRHPLHLHHFVRGIVDRNHHHHQQHSPAPS